MAWPKGRSFGSALAVFACRLLIGALEVFDLMVVEDPQARGDFIDQVVIVRDEQHAYLLPTQRLALLSQHAN